MANNEIAAMEEVIKECIKNNKITFLANLICTLQKEYQEVSELCTDGEYQITWTHKQVLDYITYQPKC